MTSLELRRVWLVCVMTILIVLVPARGADDPAAVALVVKMAALYQGTAAFVFGGFSLQPGLCGWAVICTESSRLSPTSDWVKLAPKKGVAWRDINGKWTMEPDGTLTNAGNGYDALMIFRGRVGASFKVRGDFAIESPTARSLNFGVVIGYRDGDQRDWYQCTTWGGGKDAVVDGTLFKTHYGIEAPTVKVTLQPANHFLVRVRNGSVTYQINDQTILNDYTPEGARLSEAENQVGFGSVKSGGDNITRIRNLELRKLKD